MRVLQTGLLLAGWLVCRCAHARQCEGNDLPPGDKLRVGVKHRPETCERKTTRHDQVTMHYDGILYKNCEKFDSSRDRGSPLTFVLGHGEVIKGWDQGLVGMCTGERRKLTIPSDLAYGDRGQGNIHAGATLVFEVELMDIVGS